MLKSSRHIVAILAAIISLLIMQGCGKKSPEERMSKAQEAMQANDTLTAEAEARKVVEDYPEDPASMDARMFLASIYMRDGRVDEALSEMDAILEKRPQTDSTARQVLAQYVEVLKRQRRFDDAIKTISKYQGQSGDPVTSAGLEVLKATILTSKGETTAARSIIGYFASQTTGSAEQRQEEDKYYRDLLADTYMRDGDTTTALNIYRTALDKETSNALKFDIYLSLAGRASQAGDYETLRKSAEEVTSLLDKRISDEIDPARRRELAFQLGSWYVQIGNLPGADAIMSKLFGTELPNDLTMQVARQKMLILQRQGRTTDTVAFARAAAPKFPAEAGLMQYAEQTEQALTSGTLQGDARDTSTLVLAFEKDELLIPKASMPVLDTTGTVSLSGSPSDLPESSAAKNQSTTGTAGQSTGSEEVKREPASTDTSGTASASRNSGDAATPADSGTSATQ